MASTLNLDWLRKDQEYIGKSNTEIAEDLAQKYHYIAVIKFDNMGPQFACCLTVNELEEVLGSPYCHNKEVVYHIGALESAFLNLQSQGILKMAEIEAPTQPAEIEAPTQPAETRAPVKPAEIEAPTKPAEIRAPVKPAETKTSAEQKKWWQFWKS